MKLQAVFGLLVVVALVIVGLPFIAPDYTPTLTAVPRSWLQRLQLRVAAFWRRVLGMKPPEVASAIPVDPFDPPNLPPGAVLS